MMNKTIWDKAEAVNEDIDWFFYSLNVYIKSWYDYFPNARVQLLGRLHERITYAIWDMEAEDEYQEDAVGNPLLLSYLDYDKALYSYQESVKVYNRIKFWFMPKKKELI